MGFSLPSSRSSSAGNKVSYGGGLILRDRTKYHANLMTRCDWPAHPLQWRTGQRRRAKPQWSQRIYCKESSSGHWRVTLVSEKTAAPVNHQVPQDNLQRIRSSWATQTSMGRGGVCVNMWLSPTEKCKNWITDKIFKLWKEQWASAGFNPHVPSWLGMPNVMSRDR